MLLNANGRRLYVEDRGAGDPIVFLHGLGGTSAIWHGQAEVMQRRFRAVTYDWAGAGNSERAAGAYSVEDWAEEARALCGALGIRRAGFVGHSLGAAVTITVAARDPELARAIALLGPVAKLGEAGRKAITERAAKVRADGMAAVVDAIPMGALSPATRASNPAVHALFRGMLLANDAESYARHCEALLRADAAALAGEVRAPALLLAGDCDPTAPPAAVAELARGFARAHVEIIRNAGHAMQLDQPALVTHHLLEFFA